MNQAVHDLGRMLDEAEMRVASGLQSYSSAVCDILDNYAGKGLMIDYPTGTRRSLEAAVRMCVVTSMNQTSAQITNQYIVEGNVEYVLVSAHQGARVQQPGQPYLAGHDNWQGKIYRIRGSEPGYPNLAEMTGYDIDENGKGKAAKQKYESDIKQMQINNAVQSALKDAGAKNVTAIMALLKDMDKAELDSDGTVKGLAEQVKALQESDSYLFETKGNPQTKPSGATPAGGDSTHVPGTITKEQFAKMGYKERTELYNTNKGCRRRNRRA